MVVEVLLPSKILKRMVHWIRNISIKLHHKSLHTAHVRLGVLYIAPKNCGQMQLWNKKIKYKVVSQKFARLVVSYNAEKKLQIATFTN